MSSLLQFLTGGTRIQAASARAPISAGWSSAKLPGAFRFTGNWEAGSDVSISSGFWMISGCRGLHSKCLSHVIYGEKEYSLACVQDNWDWPTIGCPGLLKEWTSQSCRWRWRSFGAGCSAPAQLIGCSKQSRWNRKNYCKYCSEKHGETVWICREMIEPWVAEVVFCFQCFGDFTGAALTSLSATWMMSEPWQSIYSRCLKAAKVQDVVLWVLCSPNHGRPSWTGLCCAGGSSFSFGAFGGKESAERSVELAQPGFSLNIPVPIHAFSCMLCLQICN